MGITTDNASNNNTFISALNLWAEKNNIFIEENNHFRCFAHVINLSVQESINSLKNNLHKVTLNFFIFK